MQSHIIYIIRELFNININNKLHLNYFALKSLDNNYVKVFALLFSVNNNNPLISHKIMF